MPLVNVGRKHLSELLKGISKFQNDAAVNYHFASIDVEDAGVSSVDNIGTLLRWSDADSAFIPFTVNADWAATTAYAIGDVVKPTAQDGLEYVAIAAGTSGGSEPTFVNVVGGTTTDGTVEWLARLPYGADVTSPLPNKASLVVTVGAAEGLGVNKAATALSATAVKMTALFRGQAGIVEEGIEGFSGLAAADQAEVRTALEQMDISVEAEAEVVDPSYVVA